LEFNSITYLLFLFAVVLFYYNLKLKARQYLILFSSFFFYACWNWKYSILLIISGITDYIVSNKIHNSKKNKHKLVFLSISIIVNLGLLFYFKYLLFFTENINGLITLFGGSKQFEILNIILPFGISFYTFETISYSVDVYRGILKPEKSFIKYALFVAFFPKLVAGPIQRANEFLPQVGIKHKLDLDLLFIGIKRIVYGLFLKVVLADNISPLVDYAFSQDFNYFSIIDLMTIGYLFGFQIYFDFSAYSHIAIGSALCLGVKIPENFNFPYISLSFKEFWKRWHISLSAWIRDYLYLPLTGTKIITSSAKDGIGHTLEKINENKRIFALFSTWIIMGFWHGSDWNFAIWGLTHAFYIFFERKIQSFWIKFNFRPIPKFIKWFIITNLIMFSWISFRVENLNDLIISFKNILTLENGFSLNLRENIYLIVFSLLILLNSYYIILKTKLKFIEDLRKNLAIKIVFFGIIIFFIFVFLETKSQFIYFQF